MDLKRNADKTMPKYDKYDGFQIPKYMHTNLSNGRTAVPASGVQILSRGDLLGAINCLFPELHLKSSCFKLKENFSLFSSKSKQNIYQVNSTKRQEPVQFQSNYMDFLTKYLEVYFQDRLSDFKNIECLIQELHNLYKQISKTYKIAPFNPNLPVLNISQCDKVVQRKTNSPLEKLSKTSVTSIKHLRSKKGPLTHKVIKLFKSQKGEVRGSDKRLRKTSKIFGQKPIERPSTKSVNETKESFVDDFEDEFGRQIAKTMEDLLTDDTFTARYESKHAADMFLIFQKSSNDNDFSKDLEKDNIKKYENSNENVYENLTFL